MNEWPDELWANERSRMWATLAASVSDAGAEIDLSPCTTESTDLSEALGLLAISFFCVGMALAGATAGWKLTRMMLRRKAIGFVPMVRHTSSQSSAMAGNGLG